MQIWKGAPKTGKSRMGGAIQACCENYNLSLKPFFLPFEAGTSGFRYVGATKTCPLCEGTGKSGRSKCNQCGGTGAVRDIIASMEKAEQWLRWFAESEYNCAILDTMDAFFQTICDTVCVELGINSPSDSDHGVAYLKIYDYVRELLAIPIAAGKGVVMVMHVYMQTRRLKGGGTVSTATFNVTGKSKQYLAGLADQILHFDIVPGDDDEGDKYVISSQGTAAVEAGDRWGIFPDELDITMTEEENDGNGLPISGAEKILECYGYLER